MRILCLGDVVGKPGRKALDQALSTLRKEYRADMTVVNGENSAGGSGISSKIAKRLRVVGCDVVTLGDHAWDQRELEPFLDEMDFLIRPANFPEPAPGRGWCFHQLADGRKAAVINLLGRVFMRYQVECPFRALDKILDEIGDQAAIIFLDFHAETTSEKWAMGHYANGRVSAVVGTHTHIPTADETILSRGTAYITDLGMTGPYDSVIGQEKDAIIRRYLTQRPVRFKVAESDVRICGVCVEVDDKTGRATLIERINRPVELPEETVKTD